MSCYVCDDTTLTVVAVGLVAAGISINGKSTVREIGQELLSLNNVAADDRYGDGQSKDWDHATFRPSIYKSTTRKHGRPNYSLGELWGATSEYEYQASDAKGWDSIDCEIRYKLGWLKDRITEALLTNSGDVTHFHWEDETPGETAVRLSDAYLRI